MKVLIHYINTVDMRRKTYETNGIETIADNDGILRLNEKHVEKGLDHKNLQQIIIKYHSDRKKHRYAPVDEWKKQVSRIFPDQKCAIKVIMDCRTTSAHKFRTRLRLNQYDVILTKEQSVVTEIMSSFDWENLRKSLNLKPTIKWLTFQLKFVQKVYLKDSVLLRLEKYY